MLIIAFLFFRNNILQMLPKTYTQLLYNSISKRIYNFVLKQVS